MLATPSTVEAFVNRVVNCKTLKGFVVTFNRLDSGTIQFFARHPYGAPQSVTIFGCDGSTCQSESGAPMCVADVAFRLKRALQRGYDYSPNLNRSHQPDESSVTTEPAAYMYARKRKNSR